MKKKSLWVVEINFKDGRGWYTTVGIGMDRESGRIEMGNWRARNNEDRFRLRKYARVPK